MDAVRICYDMGSYTKSIPAIRSPILQCAIRDDDSRRAFPALRLPARDPGRDLRATRAALHVHDRDDARPLEGQREARELVKRTVLRLRHAEELHARRRAVYGPEIRVRELAVRWTREGGGDGRRAGAGGRRVAVFVVVCIYKFSRRGLTSIR